MPIGKNVLKIEEVKIQGVNLTVKDIIEAVTFYVKVKHRGLRIRVDMR